MQASSVHRRFHREAFIGYVVGMRASVRVGVLVGIGLFSGLACGAMRQNLRNQFVSYRGAWFCEAAGCSSATAVQSKAGSNQGELRINEVKLQPHAGLVFYPGVPVQEMTATVRDCKGTSKDVPADRVQGPGRHKISGEADSWVVWIQDTHIADLELGGGECAVLVVTTHSTWDDGSTYDAEGAIKVSG